MSQVIPIVNGVIMLDGHTIRNNKNSLSRVVVSDRFNIGLRCVPIFPIFSRYLSN